MAFRHQNHGLLLALCPQDGFTALALCLHLFFHGLLDGCRRNDVLKLYPGHFDAPWVRGNIQGLLHLGIDGLPGGQRFVQLQVTDDITQGGGCQVLNGK